MREVSPQLNSPLNIRNAHIRFSLKRLDTFSPFNHYVRGMVFPVPIRFFRCFSGGQSSPESVVPRSRHTVPDMTSQNSMSG